jgi:hypothetical protein
MSGEAPVGVVPRGVLGWLVRCCLRGRRLGAGAGGDSTSGAAGSASKAARKLLRAGAELEKSCAGGGWS